MKAAGEQQVFGKNQFMLITTKNDQRAFIHVLVNPPKPNQKLKKVAGRYKKVISK